MVRLISALVLLVLIATTIWVFPWWATVVLAALAAALAAGEVADMSAKTGADVPVWFVRVAAALIVVAFVVPLNTTVPSSWLIELLLVLGILSAVVTLAQGPPATPTLTRAAVMTMAPIYVGLPLGAFAAIQQMHGPYPTTWLLAIIAISDSAQYYSGRTFGRTKLAPAISPAKTVEGAVGGLLVTCVAGYFLGPWALPSVSGPAGAILALGLAVVGIVGDLFESMLKRSVGVKDSSSLIPGHGGVLDRIDSHLFAAPVFYLALRWLA